MSKLKIVFLFILLHFFAALQATAQVKPRLFDDKEMLEVVRKGVDKMYNMEFTAARAYFSQLKPKYADNPVVPFSDALLVYWENVPLDFTGDAYARHCKLLNKAVELAELRLDEDEDDIEGVFFSLSARSLILLYNAEQGDYTKAVSGANAAYSLMKQSFELKPKYDEFTFPTGLYEYYREKYPEMHPVYKPFMFFFKSGSIERGLKEMDTASKNSIFVKREALTYLTNIYLKYEKKPVIALGYAQKLLDSAPKNIFFKVFLAEASLNSGSFQRAEPIANELMEQNANQPYKTVGYIFKGWIEEKKNNNTAEAKKYYLMAHERMSGNKAKVLYLYKDYLYKGLNRVYTKEGDTKKAKEFLEMGK